MTLTELSQWLLIFSVEANEVSAPSIEDDDVGGMPDWAIAVVVIGLGSFIFVLIFGLTVVRVHHNI